MSIPEDGARHAGCIPQVDGPAALVITELRCPVRPSISVIERPSDIGNI